MSTVSQHVTVDIPIRTNDPQLDDAEIVDNLRRAIWAAVEDWYENAPEWILENTYEPEISSSISRTI